MEKLTENPFRTGTKPYIFLENCNIDYKTGYSDCVSYTKLDTLGLKTTNGGDWCRTDGTLGKYFNIDRKKEKGKIVSVQLVGYSKSKVHKTISKNIRELFKNARCKILDIYGNNIEIDHKDGRKDIDPKDQHSDNFQPLHKTANDAKRTHCKKCKETGIRYDAKNLGYSVSQWIGTSEYKGSCVGCFWYDPVEFNSQTSQNYVKEK